MFVLKPAVERDLDELVALAEVMAPGITTFPPNKAVISKKISKSVQAFNLPLANTSSARDFLLVLHDLSTNRVIGTTGIYSHIGEVIPFYTFKRISETHSSTLPGDSEPVSVESTSLHLSDDAFKGGTEVGTLLLHPDYYGCGLGKLLAKSRYMLIRIFTNLFSEPVVAELRGWTEEGDVSPFWEAIGRHFFANMDFAKADYLSATSDNQFIADLFPKQPIYEDLLPEAARNSINIANQKGRAALNMLYNEGFTDKGFIDIFDAGATVVADFAELDTFNNTNELLISEVTEGENPSSSDTSSNDKALLASSDLHNFRVIQTNQYRITGEMISLHPDVLSILNTTPGDSVFLYIN